MREGWVFRGHSGLLVGAERAGESVKLEQRETSRVSVHRGGPERDITRDKIELSRPSAKKREKERERDENAHDCIAIVFIIGKLGPWSDVYVLISLIVLHSQLQRRRIFNDSAAEIRGDSSFAT